MKRRKGPSLFQFEHRGEALAPLAHFHRRLIMIGGLMALVIMASLLIGVVGYHYFGEIESWVDCLYNASMILAGMGPVAELPTRNGKLFASAYALFSGITLLGSVGVLLSPVLHRLLHHFHVDTKE